MNKFGKFSLKARSAMKQFQSKRFPYAWQCFAISSAIDEKVGEINNVCCKSKCFLSRFLPLTKFVTEIYCLDLLKSIKMCSPMCLWTGREIRRLSAYIALNVSRSYIIIIFLFLFLTPANLFLWRERRKIMQSDRQVVTGLSETSWLVLVVSY